MKSVSIHPASRRTILTGLIAAASLAALPNAEAQVLWSSATGSAWLTGTNWTGSATPTGTQIAQFAVNPTPGTSVGINLAGATNNGAGNQAVGAIQVTNTRAVNLAIGNSSTTTGGTLTLNGATVNAVPSTLISYERTSGSLTLQNTQASGTQTMNVDLPTTGNINVASGGSVVIASQLTGAGRVNKTGIGTLTLSAANTFTGGVRHDAGIVNLTNAGGLGSGTFTWNATNAANFKLQAQVPDGQTWTVANSFVLPATGAGGENELLRIGDGSPTAGTTLRITGVVSGGAAGQTYTLVDSDVTSNHNNTLILDNAANTLSGTIETWRGTLAITSGGALGSASLRINNAGNNGGLRLDGNNITLGAGNPIEILGAEKIDTQGNTGTINGAISGTGSLRKTGSGMLTLGGTNTYTGGATNVAGGTLRVTGGAALPDATALSLDNTAGVNFELLANETIGVISGGGATGGNVNLNGNTLTTTGATSTALNGVVSGTGKLVKGGAGVLTLGGTNTYSGGTDLNAGGLATSTGSGLGTGTLTIGTGATNGTGGSVATVLVANNAAVTLPNDIVLPSPGAATTYVLMKNTAGTGTGTELNLTGTISGGNANTVFRVNSNTTGDTTTTYRFSGTNTFQGTVELYRGAVVLTNPASLGSATLQLNGNNNTTLGDLRFTTSMTLPNTIDLFNTSNSDPIHTQGNDVTLSGTIKSTGDKALVKIGAGKLILTGTNTYTPATTISGGTLQVGDGGTTGTLGNTASITNNATLSVNRSDAFAIAQVISGTGEFRQEGAGTTTLSGANTFSGLTTVAAGNLTVGAAGALGSTTQVDLSAGTLMLAGTGDRINNNAAVNFNGGEFALDGLSEIGSGAPSNITNGLGVLILGANSTLNFGSGVNGNSVQFLGLGSYTGGTLDVTNWDGSLLGDGSERLLFSGNSASFTLPQGAVSFDGQSGYRAIDFTGYYEIVPVPEPGTILGAAALVGFVGFRERRRFRRTAKQLS